QGAAARASRDLAVAHHAGVPGALGGDAAGAGGGAGFAFGTAVRSARWSAWRAALAAIVLVAALPVLAISQILLRRDGQRSQRVGSSSRADRRPSSRSRPACRR